MNLTLDFLKLVISLVQCLAPLLEKQFNMLPIKPVVRMQLIPTSIALALSCGFGGYMSAKNVPGRAKLGWAGLAFLIVCVLLELALTSGNMPFLSQSLAAFAVRAFYVLVFSALGLAVGGFLGQP
jgi:hypothetical protein